MPDESTRDAVRNPLVAHLKRELGGELLMRKPALVGLRLQPSLLLGMNVVEAVAQHVAYDWFAAHGSPLAACSRFAFLARIFASLAW